MKKELLVAIVLLAAGGWFGFQSEAGPLAWLQSNLWAGDSVSPLEARESGSGSESGLAQGHSRESSVFLQAVAANLKQASSFETTIQVQLDFNGQPIKLRGFYAQAGQGSGKSRLELATESPASPASITKICDGRFLYTYLKQGDRQSLEFIDLRRISTARKASSPTKRVSFPKFPSTVENVLDGCLASFLENLALTFEFGELKTREVNGMSTCQIRGQWRRDRLMTLLGDSIAHKDNRSKIDWSRVSQRVPQAVVLKLANVPVYGWVPQAIEFRRQHAKGQGGADALVQARFSPPRPLARDEQAFLNIQNDEVEAVDVTHRYVDQILGIRTSDE